MIDGIFEESLPLDVATADHCVRVWTSTKNHDRLDTVSARLQSRIDDFLESNYITLAKCNVGGKDESGTTGFNPISQGASSEAGKKLLSE